MNQPSTSRVTETHSEHLFLPVLINEVRIHGTFSLEKKTMGEGFVIVVYGTSFKAMKCFYRILLLC